MKIELLGKLLLHYATLKCYTNYFGVIVMVVCSGILQVGGYYIMLVRSIRVLCGTNSVLWNILHIQFECGEYIVEYCRSIEHCYGFE